MIRVPRPGERTGEVDLSGGAAAHKQGHNCKFHPICQLIGCGRTTGIVPFCNNVGFPDTKVYVDPTLETYKLFGLTRAKDFSEVKGKSANKDSKTGTCAGFCWSCCTFFKTGKQGDVYQVFAIAINLLAWRVVPGGPGQPGEVLPQRRVFPGPRSCRGCEEDVGSVNGRKISKHSAEDQT
jgi:hypothetical protein